MFDNNIFKSCDALLVTSKSNLYYLTHFANEDAMAVMTPAGKFYFTDKRYLEDAKLKLREWNVIDIENKSTLLKSIEFLQQNRLNKVGIEEENLSAKQFLFFQERCKNVEFSYISEKLSEMRAIKSKEERTIMREAQKITDFAFTKILERIRGGVTEKELSTELEFILKSNGAEELAFPSIVAFGENTSKPHAVPSDRVLKKRDFITLDFGAKFQGYCSDMTRTVAYFAVTEEMSDCYYLVLEAGLKAIAAARSGLNGKNLDAVARDFFANNFVDTHFIHSLGHSLGIDIHENIKISKNSENILKENMVYSIEPGLYFEGKFGVRIEDVVIQRKIDVENLTNSEKQLIIIQ